MTHSNKKQFGVWMDTRHATIVGRENVDSGDFVVIAHVESGVYTRTKNEHASNNAEITLAHKFFKEITSHMQNVDEIHVTGTGDIQEQFIHYLRDTPQYKNAKAYDSTSNKMDDAHLVDLISDKFNA